jgi:hypothetical protein
MPRVNNKYTTDGRTGIASVRTTSEAVDSEASALSYVKDVFNAESAHVIDSTEAAQFLGITLAKSEQQP